MIARQVVLLLTLIVLLFEGDLLAQRTHSSREVRRVFAACALPLLVAFGLVIVRRWRGAR